MWQERSQTSWLLEAPEQQMEQDAFPRKGTKEGAQHRVWIRTVFKEAEAEARVEVQERGLATRKQLIKTWVKMGLQLVRVQKEKRRGEKRVWGGENLGKSTQWQGSVGLILGTPIVSEASEFICTHPGPRRSLASVT